MHACRFLAAFSALLALGVATACDKPDGLSCRVDGERRLIEPIPNADPRAVFVPGTGTERVALFFLRERTDGGNPLSLPSGVTAVALDAAGAAGSPVTVRAPSRLTARQGSTEAVGAIWMGDGVIWHWVERVTATDPDGKNRTRAQLVLSRVDTLGGEGAALEPAVASCGDCKITVDGVQHDGAAVIIFSAQSEAPQATPGVGVLAPVRLLANGVVRIAGPTASTASPIIDAALPVDATARLDVIDGRLWLASNGWQQPVDAAMRAAGAALPRPNPTDSLVVTSGGAAALVWTAITKEAADRSTSGGDLSLRIFDDGGTGGATFRVSTTTRALAAARAGDRFAVLHSGGGATQLSVVDARGSKLGADVPVGAISESSTSRYLIARSRTQLIDIEAASGRVVARDISCDP